MAQCVTGEPPPVGRMTFSKVMISSPTSEAASSELCAQHFRHKLPLCNGKNVCKLLMKLQTHSQNDLLKSSLLCIVSDTVNCFASGTVAGLVTLTTPAPKVMETWRYRLRRQASATERGPFSGVMAGMTCMLRQTAAGCSAVWICYHSHTNDSLVQPWRTEMYSATIS